MEKQRSFSIKPTRFLVFTFTICLSVVFLISFSTWLVKIYPFPQENHLQLNSATLLSLGFGDKASASASRVKDPIFGSFPVQENASVVVDGSESKVAVQEEVISESKSAAGEVNASEVLNGNFTIAAASYFSSIIVNDAVVADTDLTKSGNKSDLALNQSGNVEDCGKGVSNGVNCNSGSNNSKQHHVSDGTFSKKIRGSSSRSIVIERKKSGSVCDVTMGKWIFDDSYPLYTNISCPFIDEGFSCQANARLDKDYMKWRWQPQDCDIPR